MKEFINAFLKWFRNNQHSKIEDLYVDVIRLPQLQKLSREDFVGFFDRFAREGGRIQTGGYRTAPKLVENIEQHFEEFRNKMLEPFLPDFDLDSWLEWVENFKYFGRGLATIYLNRIDKNQYAIVNNKSVEGFKKLGYEIPSGPLVKTYHAVKTAADSLLEQYPELTNYFRIDAMMHFMIGEDEGQKAYNQFLGKAFFEIGQIIKYAHYFGEEYNKDSPALNLFKDTSEKLKYLVSLLGKKLGKDYIVNYSERPNSRPDRDGKVRLKNYILIGFSPDGIYPDGELFIKLAFHELNKSPVFDIEIDVNYKLPNNPFKEGREGRVMNTRMRIPVDGNFPDNWDDLVNRIKEYVAKLTEIYLMMVNRKKPVEEGGTSGKTLNLILYGPPGTGKTYETVNKALEILGEDPNNFSNRQAIKEKFAEYRKDHRIFFTTFHQNMAYEDFIEGIKPVVPEEDDDFLKYEVQDGLFMQACVEATAEYLYSNLPNDFPQSPEALSYDEKREAIKSYWKKKEYKVLHEDHSKPCVFIIDEINRGNVAQIFGELITLIEEDKRMGRKETLYAELPYSKTSFAVPPNLYLIGTMNTADRSVEALDTALRRRFSFAYMGPEPNKLSPTEDGIDLAAILTVINKRLEILKDSDHTLGHAWLWDVKNLEQLKVVFRDKILPLLQEYFYNDYEKLGLVLGDVFFVKPQQVHAEMFAPFNGGTGLAGQYDTVWQYTLKRVEDLTVEDFRTLEQQTPQTAAGEEA